MRAPQDQKTYVSSRAERERTMLRNEDMWPKWPVLPLKRYRGQGAMEPGCLYSGQGPVVFLTSMYKLSSAALSNMPMVSYESYDALMADGWQVD